MRGFLRAAAWRVAKNRYAEACAMRAAFADDPKYLRDMRPERSPEGRRDDRTTATVDLPDEEINAYLADLGYQLEQP